MLVDWENSHVKSAHIESMCILSPEKIYISTDGEYGILQKADDVDLTNVTTIDIAYVTADDHLVEAMVAAVRALLAVGAGFNRIFSTIFMSLIWSVDWGTV